ncbi:MAG: flagellar biosynthesis protein FliQ [Planctomycetota bacterium]|nr:flagellar biosynthesis protein FliQ [Planctomycetota bacterium]
MDAQFAIDLSREALTTALILGAPLLLVAMAVALVVGLLQALTQIQDQTLAFVPKIVAVLVAAGFCLPWLVQRMVEYSHTLLSSNPLVLR